MHWVGEQEAALFMLSVNGPAFIGLANLEWTSISGFVTVLNYLAKSYPNCIDENFNDTFCNDSLSGKLRRSRHQASVDHGTMRQHCSYVCPHIRLQCLTPVVFNLPLCQDLRPSVLQEMLS